jgi:hypothetical protein
MLYLEKFSICLTMLFGSISIPQALREGSDCMNILRG